ncbi:hypothetical protein N7510_010403 [Penicillium lagena]|uniref:uncharacterized protein n=1 Tax=Penicillium lagena TaxID=94218 RepID=UPI002541C927|nr:uncharacterized protein N7510_010403 [Penicillium lagena]KAJ5605249.1 hypothetical protein N7510_010403 [Penicillium lagena]
MYLGSLLSLAGHGRLSLLQETKAPPSSTPSFLPGEPEVARVVAARPEIAQQVAKAAWPAKDASVTTFLFAVGPEAA